MIWLCPLLWAAAPATTPSSSLPQPSFSAPVLRGGTRIPLVTEEPLSSKTAHEGQRLRLRVTDDVRVDGLVVIPKGTVAVGEVSRVKEKGIFGKSGKLRIRALFVEVGGTRIRVDGEASDKGEPGTVPVVLSAPLIGISAGFFSGTSARLPAGTPLDGFVWKDLPLVAGPTAPDPGSPARSP